MFLLFKLAAYSLFGYVIYEFFVGLTQGTESSNPYTRTARLGSTESPRRSRSRIQAGSASR